MIHDLGAGQEIEMSRTKNQTLRRGLDGFSVGLSVLAGGLFAVLIALLVTR